MDGMNGLTTLDLKHVTSALQNTFPWYGTRTPATQEWRSHILLFVHSLQKILLLNSAVKRQIRIYAESPAAKQLKQLLADIQTGVQNVC